jgi:hypothetical protein
MTEKEKRAVLITFSVESGKFESNYERNKFFRGLYGWKQVIIKHKPEQKEKRYEYHRDGLLDDIPHEKVDQSSFLVPENDFDKIERFFSEWRKKVMFRAFKVLLDDDFESFFDDFEDSEKMRKSKREEIE